MKIYHNDTEILDIQVEDNSYRYRAIKGDHNITLYFSLAEHVEIPVGSFCVYQNETYTLEKPESLKMKHSRNFEYTVIFESPQAKAQRFKFRNPVDGRLKFSLTAKPIEHLQMFVDNMNQRDSGWTVGQCIDAPEITLSYNHVFCNEALTQMADELETEYEFVGKQVSLWKVEYKDNPLPLSYGRGNGFKPGVGRSNYEDKVPIEILYTQGGDRNIDASKYGSSELLLPESQQIRFDGVHFEDETGFDSTKARTYVTDADGYSVRRADKTLSSFAEDSLDCSEIYPSRVGTVSSVAVVDADNNLYDIVDDTIQANLNFEDYLIAGETMTVIFQTGMLAGREFEVKYIHEAKGGKAARRFEIVPQEIDGVTMPNNTFKPVAGQDTYAVFNCMLPDAYICHDATKSGASWQMFREGVKYLYDNEEQKFSFTGELDGIWAKQDWPNIGGKIKLGGFVQFTDERFQQEGVLVRIIGIKDYINNPHSPEIELSNSTVGRSVSSDLRQIGSNEVLTEDLHKEATQFTKRRYRDAKETIEMLGEALLENFTNSINPITVRTMSLLVGDESLQFRFVSSRTNPVQVAHAITWDNEQKQLTAEAGIIQHMTLGINSISPSHSEYPYYWDMAEFPPTVLDKADMPYYLYARVRDEENSAETGRFILRQAHDDGSGEPFGAIGMRDEPGYLHLLVGILNSEYDGERSFVTLYGFTEVLPGRITTDRLVSSEGTSYFDMLNDAMKLGSALDFNSQGDGKLRIKGTIVQSESGDESPIGVYRGMYDANYTYYNGDEVAFTQNGLTSTYRFIYATPAKGIDPTNATHWQVRAAGEKGDKGDTGAQGIPGAAGSDGRTSYFHVKYSNYSDGTNMNETGGKYIGTYVDYAVVDSPDKTKYTWVLVKGAQGDKGDQGIAGINGENGKTSYLHIAYADSADGQTNFSVSDSVGKLYIGQYTDFVQTDSSDPSHYTWTKIKGEQGDKGDQGEQGDVGDFYEYRYAKNGSTTTPPNIDTVALNPSGWSTIVPTVGNLEYLWTTIAKKSGDGTTLLQNWSTPVRITPKDGDKGDKGESPALVFRGTYDAAATYYGNANRIDCVKSGTEYYVARIDAGTFPAIAPTPDANKWNSFGASFESVATNLLLAENANIAGWIFRNGRMESQTTDSSGNPMAYLDGTKGEVRLKGTIQHSTGFNGNYSDVDLFSLPARTTVMLGSAIDMGSEKEDIGKRCLLTNTSALGSMGYYRIRSSRFGWNGNYTPIGDTEIYLLAPGETIEMTCFELPSGSVVSGTTVEGGGHWKVTNRYHKELAPVVAMGKVINSTSGATISGNSIAGTDFSVSRNGTDENNGLYTITLPEFFKYATNLLVMLTGIGYVQGSATSPAKATLISQSGRTLTVMVSDDATPNGGSFEFVIYSFGGFSI